MAIFHDDERGSGSWVDAVGAAYRADERTFDIGRPVPYLPVCREELLAAAAAVPQARELMAAEMGLRLGDGQTVADRLARHPGSVARILPARRGRKGLRPAQVYVLLPKKAEGACEPLTLISEARE